MKAIPFTAAHTYIAHIWQYPPPPRMCREIMREGTYSFRRSWTWDTDTEFVSVRGGGGEFRENERAFFPQGQSKLSNIGLGAPNDDARQQQRGLMVVGGTRVSRDGDDLMRTKIKTKKKARTSNKKPKKIP